MIRRSPIATLTDSLLPYTALVRFEFGGQGAGMADTIVFRADAGVDDPEVQSTIESLVTMVSTLAEDGAVDVRDHEAFAALDEEALTALEEADLALRSEEHTLNSSH